MAPLQITAERLTHEAWAPYGDLIQGGDSPAAFPPAVADITLEINANPIKVRCALFVGAYHLQQKWGGFAIVAQADSPLSRLQGHKFNRVSPISNSYPTDAQPTPVTAISVIRIGPPAGLELGGVFQLRMFERHAATT